MIGITKQGGIHMEQTLGKRIVSHRKGLGLTQDQLAEQLGLTAQAVSKWENDQSCPDITMLPRLAKIFGVTTDALLGIEEEPVREAELVSPEPDEESEGIHIQKGNWEFRWDSGRKNRLGMALLVLLVGGLLMAGNVLGWPVSFWGLLWPCALLVFGLGGIYPEFHFFQLSCALFGAYFLADELALLPDAWSSKMIFPAILVLLGISLLVKALRHPASPRFHIRRGGDHHKFSSSCRLQEEGFVCETTFGEDHRVIDLPRLSRGRMDCSFGDLTVDLTGCEEISADCRLTADCSFGNLTILMPRRFRAEPDTDSTFGNVDIQGDADADAQPLALACGVSFGSITIQYV